MKLESESFQGLYEVKSGEEVKKTWSFRNVGAHKIPFDCKLVKIRGEDDFGPSEIRINRTIPQDGTF